MIFARRNDIYLVSRITGPKHNFLGLRLSNEIVSRDIVIERRGNVRASHFESLDPNKIKENVLKAVADANAEFGVTFAPDLIQYVGDDTPPEEVYGLLAHEIIRRLSAFGEAGYVSTSKT